MSATLQLVAVDVVSIKETTKELKDSVENIQLRRGEAEQRISDVEDMHAEMKKNTEKCEERMETLLTCVEDLENQRRRNNIRKVGLKEGKEEMGKVAHVERIISEGLGPSGNKFKIERARRSLAAMPNNALINLKNICYVQITTMMDKLQSQLQNYYHPENYS